MSAAEAWHPGHPDRSNETLNGVIATICAMYLSTGGWLVSWALLAIVMPFWHPVAITGNSMAPRISAGDLVILADADDTLAPGMVATFALDGGRLVTHRVVDVRDDGTYTTRGDANPAADSTPVDPDDVYGRGRLLVPYVTWPLVWMRQGQWLRLLGWLGVTALAIHGLQRWQLRIDPTRLPAAPVGRQL